MPDICANIEYPTEKSVTKRYIDWCNSHIFASSSGADDEFTGAALYQLRCHFLHNGDDEIFKNNGETWTRVRINEFDLMEPKDSCGEELLLKISTMKDTDTGEITYKAKMNLRYIIDLICDSAEEFYDSWTNKSDFDDHVVNLLEYNPE